MEFRNVNFWLIKKLDLFIYEEYVIKMKKAKKNEKTITAFG